jgi:hypothetical protein
MVRDSSGRELKNVLDDERDGLDKSVTIDIPNF